MDGKPEGKQGPTKLRGDEARADRDKRQAEGLIAKQRAQVNLSIDAYGQVVLPHLLDKLQNLDKLVPNTAEGRAFAAARKCGEEGAELLLPQSRMKTNQGVSKSKKQTDAQSEKELTEVLGELGLTPVAKKWETFADIPHDVQREKFFSVYEQGAFSTPNCKAAVCRLQKAAASDWCAKLHEACTGLPADTPILGKYRCLEEAQLYFLYRYMSAGCHLKGASASNLDYPECGFFEILSKKLNEGDHMLVKRKENQDIGKVPWSEVPKVECISQLFIGGNWSKARAFIGSTEMPATHFAQNTLAKYFKKSLELADITNLEFASMFKKNQFVKSCLTKGILDPDDLCFKLPEKARAIMQIGNNVEGTPFIMKTRGAASTNAPGAAGFGGTNPTQSGAAAEGSIVLVGNRNAPITVKLSPAAIASMDLGTGKKRMRLQNVKGSEEENAVENIMEDAKRQKATLAKASANTPSSSNAGRTQDVAMEEAAGEAEAAEPHAETVEEDKGQETGGPADAVATKSGNVNEGLMNLLDEESLEDCEDD
jgi:hypothetical protein